MKRCNAAGVEIVLANVGGTFYALNNACPHRPRPLCDGTLEGSTLRCPLHQATFDVTTGKNLAPAKIGHRIIPMSDIQRYPVKIEGANILVEIP